MEILDPTLKWKRRHFTKYCPNSILSLCFNLGLDSDYMVPEVNDLGVTSAVGLDLLFLEDTEVFINFSLIKSWVALLTSLAGEFNLRHLNCVDT